MPDTIPAAKVAAAALHQVQAAADLNASVRYSSSDAEAQKIHLRVAAELLTLICGEPTVAEVVPDPKTVVAGSVAEAPPEFFAEPAPHRDPRDEVIQF